MYYFLAGSWFWWLTYLGRMKPVQTRQINSNGSELRLSIDVATVWLGWESAAHFAEWNVFECVSWKSSGDTVGFQRCHSCRIKLFFFLIPTHFLNYHCLVERVSPPKSLRSTKPRPIFKDLVWNITLDFYIGKSSTSCPYINTSVYTQCRFSCP